MRLLVLTKRETELQGFMQEIHSKAGPGTVIEYADSLESGLQKIRSSSFQAAVLDEGVLDGSLREAVMDLLRQDAFMTIFLISAEPEETLHDTMEGFGIAGFFPYTPQNDSATALVDTLHGLGVRPGK